MNIVHFCHCVYTDGFGYQDNVLPKYHAKQGHNVTVITTCYYYDKNGDQKETEPEEYDCDGFHVIRVKRRSPFWSERWNNVMRSYKIYDILVRLKPDLLMVHGFSNGYIIDNQIIRYIKKNKRCILVGDTHTSEANYPAHPRRIKQRILWEVSALEYKRIMPYYDGCFGVEQASIDYNRKYLYAPETISLLPLGYDPDNIDFEHKTIIRKNIRDKLGIRENDILFIHGGKITDYRKTDIVIETLAMLDSPNIKLIIFGGITCKMKPKIEKLLKQNSSFVIYLGQLKPKEYCDLMLAADIGFFPGGHSTIFREAVGCGLPMIIAKTSETDDLSFDFGGNVLLVRETSIDGYVKEINKLIEKQLIKGMAEKAIMNRESLSYERIASIVTCIKKKD